MRDEGPPINDLVDLGRGEVKTEVRYYLPVPLALCTGSLVFFCRLLVCLALWLVHCAAAVECAQEGKEGGHRRRRKGAQNVR